MQIRIFLFLAISLTSAIGHAQQVYRCGSTFSQQPCGPDAKLIGKPPVTTAAPRTAPAVFPVPVPVPVSSGSDELAKLRYPVPDVVPLDTVVAASKGLCEKGARAALKDPESARVTDVVRTGAGNHYHLATGRVVTGSQYTLKVNAKNSYGGYTGVKMWSCVLTLDESKLLFVQELGA